MDVTDVYGLPTDYLFFLYLLHLLETKLWGCKDLPRMTTIFCFFLALSFERMR